MRFDQKYDHDAFCTFLRDFLPEDYVEKEKDISDLSRCKIITKARELGHSPSLDVYVLEMNHAKEKDPRVSIATDAFKLLAMFGYDKALVIFKNDESENYRFSYLTIALDLNEKNKVVAKYSNARRYSFFLGEGAKTKTPEQQLLKRRRITDTNDLLSRFSLEVVNKQFYLEVAKYFDELVSSGDNNLRLPSVSEENVNLRKSFAVRLIGRLMFCWFLKQKKSESGPLISDELLSTQAVVKSKGYYHGVLEPLFFEVLNTPGEERGVRTVLYDQVPYLNGGLFNPQRDDYYELDRSTYVSRYLNTLVIQDKWFRDFFGLLETYNFTIDENTVFDQELSVDPEMLGRIFENLLAEINPETGSSERKRTGSFYTPRQTVEYMVDQSLLSHLKSKTQIDRSKLEALINYDQEDDINNPFTKSEESLVVDAIADLRVLDPACGSGAFPVGMLQKIVYILQHVDPDCSLWIDKKLQTVPDLWKQRIQEYYASHPANYIRKLDVIKGSIFGVDIQPIAVEVSRLRCFLTLVVESEIDDTKINRGIEPLPNLDFKFVCANTLVLAPDLNDENGHLFGDNFQKNLETAVDKYFSSAGANKASASNEIHKLIDGKVDEKLKHLENLVSYNGDRRIEALRAKTNRKEIDQHSRILNLWSSYKNIFENEPVGFFDPKYFFPSVKEGFNVVIGNPPYKVIFKDDDNYNYYKDNFELNKGGKMNLYRLFFERGLPLLSQSGTLTYISPDNYLTSKDSTVLRRTLLDKYKIVSIVDYTEKDHVFETVTQAVAVVVISNEWSQNYNFLFTQYGQSHELSAEEIRQREGYLIKPLPEIISKIESQKGKLSDISNGYQGEINVSTDKEHFVTEEKEGYLPLIRGNNIGKYFLKKPMVEYCPIRIQKRDHFEMERVIFQEVVNSGLSSRLNATMVTEPVLCGHSTNYLFPKIEEIDSYFLLGILNSTVFNFYFKFFNQTNHAPIGEVKNIPVPKTIESKMIDQISNLASKILTQKNNGVDTSELEKQIDGLVYKLYDLTPEEIGIVEGLK
ncbi:MAG: Eco57I restriction-modification methylase domain-containing protein [Candidatus Paceibacterota bacterium]